MRLRLLTPLLLLPLLGLPSLSNAAAPAPVAVQHCGGSSWWAGTTDLCDGAVVYRDYVYDDAGADTGDTGYGVGTQNAYGTLAHPAGDVRYPADDTTSADLVRLELRREGERVRVVAELNALRSARSTVLAVAVDTDGSARTGGGAWPDVPVRSAGWDRVFRFAVGDPRTNTITGTFPLPAAAAWRVQAVTAQAATGDVMNVAYRGPSEGSAYKLSYDVPSPHPVTGRGAWFEDDQAAALADGDISRFGQVVHTADLRAGTTRLARIEPGLHERVYTSRYDLGEGLSYKGIKGRGDGGSAPAFAQVFNLLGRYQPYGVYVPRGGAPYGLQMEWHGSNQGIVAQINQPGMQRRFGEELHRVLVVPEARGPNGYGSDISERDLLDVMADVQRAVPVDPGQVFSSGYSQGGYIAFRMAMLHPDRFAGFTSWVGFTGDDLNGTPLRGTAGVTAGAVGNMIDYVPNLRHVPGAMLFSGADELVQLPSSTAMQRAFAATDNTYAWWLHTTADHFVLAAADDWAKEAAYSRGQRRVLNPARVTFRTSPELDAPAYGIRHDRAYWVSGLRGRDGGVLETDLTSAGCGGSAPVLAERRTAGVDPVPWVGVEQGRTGSRPLARRAALSGSLTNVAALVVDTTRACLRGALAYDVTSDGPAVLRLSDGRSLRLRAGANRGVLRG